MLDKVRAVDIVYVHFQQRLSTLVCHKILTEKLMKSGWMSGQVDQTLADHPGLEGSSWWYKV